jgi:hypothetical protein
MGSASVTRPQFVQTDKNAGFCFGGLGRSTIEGGIRGGEGIRVGFAWGVLGCFYSASFGVCLDFEFGFFEKKKIIIIIINDINE